MTAPLTMTFSPGRSENLSGTSNSSPDPRNYASPWPSGFLGKKRAAAGYAAAQLYPTLTV